MPTPAIQTLINDAQQVLNLDSISAVRSVVAVSLANANTGTPLNPNLTTQQLWNEFYQVVPRSKSDIESIIANQLMKFLYSPPAPGGVGANGQVIFNNNGVLAGDNELFYNATTNTLTTEKLIVPGNTQVAGSASNLYVGSILNPTLFVNTNTNRVGVLNAAPNDTFTIASDNYLSFQTASTGFNSGRAARIGAISAGSGNGYLVFETYQGGSGGAERYRIASDGVATWSNVGGGSGTAMTLNSTGLGVGGSPTRKLSIVGSGNTYANINSGDNTSLVGVLFGGTSAPSNGQIIYNNTDNSMGMHTAGAVKLTIDSSGNVGIGVTTPTSQLTVGTATANPAATVAFHKSTANEYRLKLTSGSFNSNGNWIGLGLGYSSDYMKVAIIAEAKDGNGRGNLHFALNDAVTSANASIADARMTLKSTGQVRFVPLAADPSGAEAGDVYYNSTSNKLKCYNGTTWNDLF